MATVKFITLFDKKGVSGKYHPVDARELLRNQPEEYSLKNPLETIEASKPETAPENAEKEVEKQPQGAQGEPEEKQPIKPAPAPPEPVSEPTEASSEKKVVRRKS